MSIIKTDVLIIGGGGAAARAAIEVSKFPVNVAMVIKGRFPSGTTPIAMGSMAAVLREDDNPEIFYQDIISGGYFLNNRKLARILANESKNVFEDLNNFGTEFRKTNKGILYIGHPTGTSKPRAALTVDHNFMKGLVSEVKETPIKIWEQIMITDLLRVNNSVIGAIGFNYITGESFTFSTKAIILATGGLGQIFKLTSMPPGATGDGYVMGLSVGAELMDMEFTQAMVCVIYPEAIRGLAPPFDGFVKFGAKFYNGLKERFMERYEPEKMEDVTRDVASICVFKEIQAGRGTSHGGVIMDISPIPWSLLKSLMPKIYHAYDRQGLDATKIGIEWAPGCHHQMGGLIVNERCETNIKGLYAVGEVVGGVHGANRLGGNSLTATQVFGKIAGQNAAEFAKSVSHKKLPHEIIEQKEKSLYEIYERADGVNYSEVKEKIKEIMSNYAWIIKNEKNLNLALESIIKLKKEKIKLPEKTYRHLKGALETLNMIEVSELVVRASLIRTESRGAHYREDYPYQDDKNWLKNIIFYKEKDEFKSYSKEIEKE
ncbi:MAG: FAD-binding protein [Promethearchaeota archaeon]